MKLVFEEVDSSTSIYWMRSLKDLGIENIKYGLKKAGEFTGTLTLGRFREMCGKPVLAPYHKPFLALPCKPMERDVLRAKLAKMREELCL